MPRKVERNARILTLAAEGKTLSEIATTFGISAGRVSKILAFYDRHPNIAAADIQTLERQKVISD